MTFLLTLVLGLLLPFSANASCIPFVTCQCSDGISNDCDGLIDMADPGCSGTSDDTEMWGSRCDNCLDDDDDGLVDFPEDPGCETPLSVKEDPQCSDGRDNDFDRRIDFPEDLGCDSLWDKDERGLGGGPCDDGINNDCSSGRDFNFMGFGDDGCTEAEGGADDPSERSPTLVCDDGLDNDGDGRTDYQACSPLMAQIVGDDGCKTVGDPTEQPDCGDGIDNDGDGLIDWAGYQNAWGDPECTFLREGICGGASDGFCCQRLRRGDEEDPDYVPPECPINNGGSGGPVCGIGWELALVLPGLMWLYGRRRNEKRV